VIAYRTKWLAEWIREWFYVKVDSKKWKEFEGIVVSPLILSFSYRKPLSNMALGSVSQVAHATFNIVVDRIGTHDFVQEFLANQTFPTLFGWGISKPKKRDEETKSGVLKVFPYCFKKHPVFKCPRADWLTYIELVCNEILRNYTIKEDRPMMAAFRN
jgi:hypothetical protein